MDKYIAPQLLADNADRKENYNYFKQYSEEELSEFKSDLAEVSLDINDLELEKKETVARFNEQLKEPKEAHKKLLVNIRQKGEFVEEDCFVMIDLEAREVGIYNPNGHLVHQRPCRPNELQATIFQMKKSS